MTGFVVNHEALGSNPKSSFVLTFFLEEKFKVAARWLTVDINKEIVTIIQCKCDVNL